MQFRREYSLEYTAQPLKGEYFTHLEQEVAERLKQCFYLVIQRLEYIRHKHSSIVLYIADNPLHCHCRCIYQTTEALSHAIYKSIDSSASWHSNLTELLKLLLSKAKLLLQNIIRGYACLSKLTHFFVHQSTLGVDLSDSTRNGLYSIWVILCRGRRHYAPHNVHYILILYAIRKEAPRRSLRFLKIEWRNSGEVLEYIYELLRKGSITEHIRICHMGILKLLAKFPDSIRTVTNGIQTAIESLGDKNTLHNTRNVLKLHFRFLSRYGYAIVNLPLKVGRHCAS